MTVSLVASEARALRAAIEVAAAHGLACDAPVVVGRQSNLLVHLRPHHVVARVATATSVRSGTAWQAREVAVARHVAAAGAPVVAPTSEMDPGPHVRDGLSLSFWELVEETGVPVDAREAGRALRVCHEVLTGFAGELPPYGAFEEARSILGRADVAAALGADDSSRLACGASRLSAALADRQPRLQALHGDAHLGNVWLGRRGTQWGDLEDTCLGPVEWDLACLVTASRVFGQAPAPAAAALAGYDARPDEALLDLLVEARAFQVIVWNAVLAPTRPDGPQRLEARLAHLRARPGWSAP